MTDERNERNEGSERNERSERNQRAKRADQAPAEAKPRAGSDESPRAEQGSSALPCWPFPVGSQNDTDKAVKLKPYVPPKRRTLNQY